MSERMAAVILLLLSMAFMARAAYQIAYHRTCARITTLVFGRWLRRIERMDPDGQMRALDEYDLVWRDFNDVCPAPEPMEFPRVRVTR